MTASISVVGLGYRDSDVTFSGHAVLRAAGLILHSTDVEATKLRRIAPEAETLALEAKPRFLEERSGFYDRAALEILDVAKSGRTIALAVHGNPFVLDGISSRLIKAGSVVRVIPAASIVECLLELDSTLLGGHGFRVVDTTNAFFSCGLDARVDLILVQFSRAGSKLHTLGYTPNKAWYGKLLSFLRLTYPPETEMRLYLVGEQTASAAASLAKAEDIYDFLAPNVSIVIKSPYKDSSSEGDVMERLIGPVEYLLSHPD